MVSGKIEASGSASETEIMKPLRASVHGKLENYTLQFLSLSESSAQKGMRAAILPSSSARSRLVQHGQIWPPESSSFRKFFYWIWFKLFTLINLDKLPKLTYIYRFLQVGMKLAWDLLIEKVLEAKFDLVGHPKSCLLGYSQTSPVQSESKWTGVRSDNNCRKHAYWLPRHIASHPSLPKACRFKTQRRPAWLGLPTRQEKDQESSLLQTLIQRQFVKEMYCTQ